MAKIKLTNGNEYQLAVNGWNKTDTALALTVIATDMSLEDAETEFTGNENIKMTDASVIINAYGYATVQSIGIEHDAVIGGLDKEGEDVRSDVWHITLTKASLEERVSANEDAIAELAEIIAEEEA